ncbi:hypothetical protein DEU38_11559 [Rhodococcus sp. AG1013]|nr:hypothetical protein DEU38_11559 [Rhodococcus sp. AG1013]
MERITRQKQLTLRSSPPERRHGQELQLMEILVIVALVVIVAAVNVRW